MGIYIKSHIVSDSKIPSLSHLIISPEYLPMPGGVGRYTCNLKKNLVEMGFTVSAVCDERGDVEYSGISQHNPGNSGVLLELVDNSRPDLVHIRYEPGLYGLKLDMLKPRKSSTNIDTFYDRCRVPIITTFHSAYPFRQWMSWRKRIHMNSHKEEFHK